jgi:hypothetical protein
MIGQHACGAQSCDTAIPDKSFMCDDHMKLLSAPLRHAVGNSYTPRQLPCANPYLSAAVDTVAHTEKRGAARSGRRKAVQLALFDI